jgi:hypothetical protein
MKISQLTALVQSSPLDYLPILDSSDTAQGLAGSVRKILVGNLTGPTFVITPTGNNDDALIAQVVAAIKSFGKGSLYLRGGLVPYDIHNTILLPSYITVFGDGKRLTKLILANGVNKTVLTNDDTVNGNTGINLYGFEIDGNKANNISGNIYGILFNNVTDFEWRNIFAHDTRTHGVEGRNVTDGILDTVVADNCGSSASVAGIAFNAQGFSKQRIKMINCKSTNNKKGFHLKYSICQDIQLINCYASGNSEENYLIGESATEIQLTNCKGYNAGINNLNFTQADNCTVTNFRGDTTTVASGSYGCQIGTNSHDIQINGAKFLNSGDTGLIIGTGCDNVKLSNVDAYESYFHGIRCNGGTNVQMVNCTAYNNNNNGGSISTRSGIVVDSTSLHVQLLNCRAYDSQASKTQGYGLNIGNSADYVTVENCDFVGNSTGAINNTSSGTNNKIRNNQGYITEASGTASITSGSTSVTVTHGLSVTPSAQHLSVVITANPTNDPGNIYITNITATQFTINSRNDPGASNLSLGWRANVI